MKKSGEAILDTNVWVVIGIVSLVLILSGFFLYGDKIQGFISNFLPEYETGSGVDELIAQDGDTDVSYILEVGESLGNKKATPEELSGYSSDINSFYNNFVRDFVVVKIVRSEKEIVKLNSYAEGKVDPNPKTNFVRISFQGGYNTNVDFSYDAKEKLVYFGNENTGKVDSCDNFTSTTLNGLAENSGLFGEKIGSYFSSYGSFSKDSKNLGSDDVKDILTICSSKGLDDFIMNIISVIDREKDLKYSFGTLGDNQYLVRGSSEFSNVPGDSLEKKKNYIYTLLVNGRPYYESSWKEGGYFLSENRELLNDLSYSCIKDGKYFDCSKISISSELYYYDFCSIRSQHAYSLNSTNILTSSPESLVKSTMDSSIDCNEKVGLYPYKPTDKVFYNKGNEIWVAQYSASVKNYCHQSIVSGSICR